MWNVSPAAVPQFQRAGGLVPLNSFPGGEKYARERVGDRVDQYFSSDGKLYQLPWKTNPVMIIYNKELFEKAGLDPENPKLATYDEFRRTAETLHRELGIAAIWPSADQMFYQVWFDYYPTFIAASGGEQLIDENGKANFDSDIGIEVGEFWRSLYDAGVIPQESATVDAFAEEKSAMSLVGPWAVAVDGDVDWGVVPVPIPDGTPPEDIYTFSDAKNVSIFSACKNQKTAFDFMKFATSEKSDEALLEATGQMPLRENVQQVYAPYFEENPSYVPFAEQSARTGGVILGTLVIGVLAGYALSRLRWRGRGLVFNIVLLTLIMPFQLLMIPMYVMVVLGWGLGDSYLGMILPFLVNSTAVFIFRQFFMQLPEDMLDAARIDGAGELTILTRIVLPLSRPVILTATLITFIGPWNEFLWPFLVTKDAALQPLAVARANYISNVASSTANPFGAILASAVVLSLPAVALFVIFQRYFAESETSASIKE